MKQEIIEYLPSKGCRRKKCYAPVTEREHEFDSEGRTPTGALGSYNLKCGPIVFRRIFRKCLNRAYPQCREKY